MQTKSEMINRIAELAEEVEQRKQEYEVLDACLELAQGKIAELKAENERLKEEMCSNCDFQKQYFVETKNLLDENKKLRNKICKERAETREDFEKIKQTLQEIKAIAEDAINGEYKTKSSDYSEGMEIIGHYVMQKITKAESEG